MPSTVEVTLVFEGPNYKTDIRVDHGVDGVDMRDSRKTTTHKTVMMKLTKTDKSIMPSHQLDRNFA